ncbi:adhesion G protein-coupled receptor E5 isoform X2 [Hemicordylus capensis]|uniref:adhesion G protein-coupled receptor E5 isoform X2 n=1 Tax=Hemicordylus capensis TaxID=884348 RepID=UPI0023035206|nr:adhesion G protein-coupled receptor E5 isoform X2 [Hemicordylus capensis]
MEPALRRRCRLLLLLALGLCMTLIQSGTNAQSFVKLCINGVVDPCNCTEGYEPCSKDDPVECCDINECTQGLNRCGSHQQCRNTAGNSTCECLKGFQFKNSSGSECEDVDECKKNPCDKSANCTNFIGGYKCECPLGYFQETFAGPGKENTTKCKEFDCPMPLSNDCSDGQVQNCNYTTQLRSFCNSLVQKRQDSKDLTDLLDLLDQLVGLVEKGNTTQRHRMATMLMEMVEVWLRGVAFTLPEGPMSARSSQGTELAMEVRAAGNHDQSSVKLLQDKAQMELNWKAASGEGEAFRLAGLLSYRNLGPILSEAPVEGDQWKEITKASPWTRYPGKHDYEILSRVAAAFVGHKKTQSLNVDLVFSHPEPEWKPGQRLLCAFWNPVNGSGSWSTEGCRVLESNTTRTHCQCTHLTSFAVLMAFYQLEEDKCLDVITKVGLVVSLICLFLSILTFLFCRTIRGLRTTIHLHLCLALFAAYVIFLMGAGHPENKTACATVAALLHYCFLSVFCWMLLEGVELYLMVVQVFKTHCLKHWHIFLVGYGLPAVVVGISAAANHKGYGTEIHCWLSLEDGFLWSFLAPVCLIIMVNAVVFVITVWRLTEKFADINPDISELKKLRVLTVTAIAQLCILGTTWIFGLFQFNSRTLFVSYIFTILNTLQGIFIFLLHCLLKNQVRDDYYRLFCQGRRDKIQSSDKYSEFSSTTGSNTLRANKSLHESGI